MPKRATIYTYLWNVSDQSALDAGGIDGFACYNYGLLRRAHLEWIGVHRHVWS